VIPLGTRLYIEGYGYATAEDIGRAIKGDRVDVFFESESDCARWGRRYTKVYILD
jgi:3D (Asp-Asp-Asp) domain-containing protein